MGAQRKPRAKSEFKAQEQAAQRAWLDWLVQETGRSLSELAVSSGLSDVALTRFRNRDDYEGTLSALTIRALREHTGLAGPDTYRDGFREEVSPYEPSAPDADATVREIVAVLLRERPAASPKVVRTRALAGAGYLPGDVVIVEQGLLPRNGDVVIAQVYDEERGAAETVLRLYRKASNLGFLMPPDAGEALLDDGKVVKVMGVVTEAFRPRSRAAS